MTAHKLFISDVHLQEQTPSITAKFKHFMTTHALQAEALYILGDLFEFWIGDDDNQLFNCEILTLIQTVSKKIPVFFMHGNRDFLIGKRFATVAGMQILPDPSVIDVYGQAVVLSHGDILCTDDIHHQKYRRIVSRASVQNIFQKIPLYFRRRIANSIRSQSKRHNRNSPRYITDINSTAAIELLEKNNCRLLIHGHTHRPGVHSIKLANSEAQRIVLGAWHDDCDYLQIHSNGEKKLLKYR